MIGKKVKLLRLKNSWSQEDVAGRLGISIPAYSKIETGITDINLSRLQQLAAVFEMSIVELLLMGETNSNETTLQNVKAKLASSDARVLELQQELIRLYEALRSIQVN